MADSELLYEVKDRIATITLNRPDKMNAFTGPMIERWAASLHEAQADPNVNVVVVTGAGKAFCSGGDVGRMGAGDPTPLDNKNGLWEHIHRVPKTLEAMDKPVIAMVNGVAVGAGMGMSLMCDVRIASDAARFSTGYVRVGLVPGDGDTYFLPRLIGTARALELVGERWSLLILRNAAFAGHTRFGEFQKSLELAPNILAARLAYFVETGLMTTAKAPDGHETYHLTRKGLDFVPVLVALNEAFASQVLAALRLDARDAALDFVRTRFGSGKAVHGWEVDDACRAVVDKAGFGQSFIHRTGHSIGEEVHGNGVNIDNLETRDERELVPGICFSIEPGIYLKGEMAARSEINVFITPAGKVEVAGAEQRDLVLLDV